MVQRLMVSALQHFPSRSLPREFVEKEEEASSPALSMLWPSSMEQLKVVAYGMDALVLISVIMLNCAVTEGVC
jgi:hypothetical protein